MSEEENDICCYCGASIYPFGFVFNLEGLDHPLYIHADCAKALAGILNQAVVLEELKQNMQMDFDSWSGISGKFFDN